MTFGFFLHYSLGTSHIRVLSLLRARDATLVPRAGSFLFLVRGRVPECVSVCVVMTGVSLAPAGAFFCELGSLLRNEPQYPTMGYAPHSGRGLKGKKTVFECLSRLCWCCVLSGGVGGLISRFAKDVYDLSWPSRVDGMIPTATGVTARPAPRASGVQRDARRAARFQRLSSLSLHRCAVAVHSHRGAVVI